MKRIIWMIFIFTTMYTLGQAQINTQKIERNVQNSVAKQNFQTIFCMMTGLCAEKQNGQLAIDEKQAQQDMQTVVDQQDLAMHELYTENYLKQAREKGIPLGITRDAQDPRKLFLLGDFYLFEGSKAHEAGLTSNYYTHPRGEQGINILLGTKQNVETEAKQLKALFKGTGFVLQTYDLRTGDDGMISFYKEKNQGGHYIVFRVFRTDTGNVATVNVSRTLSRKNLVIMRGMYQALAQTDRKVLTEHFVTKECKLGADCY